MKTFQSVFAEPLSAFLELRRTLGFRWEGATVLLRSFDAYVYQRHHAGPLTQELALGFALSKANTTPHYCAHRYRLVRQFSQYLAIYDPTTPRLDPKVLPYSKARNPRHIYTDEELGHVSVNTTHQYIEADLEMKRRALDKCATPELNPAPYQPTDEVLALLESL